MTHNEESDVRNHKGGRRVVLVVSATVDFHVHDHRAVLSLELDGGQRHAAGAAEDGGLDEGGASCDA